MFSHMFVCMPGFCIHGQGLSCSVAAARIWEGVGGGGRRGRSKREGEEEEGERESVMESQYPYSYMSHVRQEMSYYIYCVKILYMLEGRRYY